MPVANLSALGKYAQPFLMFTMKLEDTHNLEAGRLALIDYTVGMNPEYIWKSSSGLPGHQSFADQSAVGRGELPPPYRTNNPMYYVKTEKAYSDEIGIAGYYFFISPETINVDGTDRSMLRVHYDANVPGTAGCIGILSKDAFDFFVAVMDTLKGKGFSQVPLFILYPYGDT